MDIEYKHLENDIIKFIEDKEYLFYGFNIRILEYLEWQTLLESHRQMNNGKWMTADI